MIRWTISSVTDIETYVDDTHADFVKHGLRDALVETIRADSDTPDYGADWTAWLEANIERLRVEATPRTAVDVAREAFYAAAVACGSDAYSEEQAILSIGREFLPAHALAVLDQTGEPTVEYWEWLTEQTETAQAEHGAAVAAGRQSTS